MLLFSAIFLYLVSLRFALGEGRLPPHPICFSLREDRLPPGNLFFVFALRLESSRIAGYEIMGVPPRWLIRPAALHRSVLTLYLSSPPSGCNPDSDSSPLSLSPFREVLARSESTWLGILTPIQVLYFSVFLFSCQGSVYRYG